MGAIVLDASKVNSYVLPSLTKSENFMQKAYSASVSLKNNLPSSFNQRSVVNEIVNQIYNLKKEISNIDKIIENKIELAKKIELKSESRVNSISQQASKISSMFGIMGGAALGATTGGIVGAAVGAAVGGQVSNTLGKTIIDTGTKIVKSFVSGVKKIFTNTVNFVKDTGAKIEKGIKSIWSKFSGAIKNIGNKVVNATKSIGKAIYNTGAKVVKETVSTVKKIGKKVSDGFKWIGSKVVSGVKTAAKWVGNAAKTAGEWVGDKFNKAKDWVCQAAKNTGAWICNAGTTIWKGLKTAWNWATDIENWKKVGASVMNATLSFVKGVVSLVEAIGDFAVIVGSGISTIGTALYDVGKGIVTGNWDWSATNGLWDGTKGVVAYNWTNALDKSLGWRQYFDKWAYDPFKSDGIACQITEGVGYVAGTIALTVATFGVGGVATGAATSVSAGVSATTLAATATAAGMGKYTAEEWNKNSISLNYGGTNMDIAIDYNTYLEIEKLKQGESTTITQQLTGTDGKIQELTFHITSKGNGQYDITDSNGNSIIFNSLNESNTAKGIGIGAIKAAWEGAQWYVGGKIGAGEFTKITGKVSSPVLNKIATSGIRVGLDMATGVAEVPFQSLVTMISDGKTWNEAWESQGGWNAVKAQAGIAGITSFAGEAFSFKGILKNSDVNKDISVGVEPETAMKSTIEETTMEKLNDVDISKQNVDLLSVEKKNVNSLEVTHVKLWEMDVEDIRTSIKEEISQLDSSAPDYASKVTLLAEKESLEIELIHKMSQISSGPETAKKSLDLLSLSDQQQVKKVAQFIYDKAVNQEFTVTHAMKQLVDSETTLEGLDFRIKSLDSIQDKLARKLYQGYDTISMQNGINDSLRYTLIVNGNYEETVLKKLGMLQKNGFMVVDLNNAWGNSTYQGLNVTLKTQDGLLVELQFHTSSSFNAKQVINHELYELSRNISTSDDIRSISDRIQAINQDIYVGKDVKFVYKDAKLLNEAATNFYKKFEFNNAMSKAKRYGLDKSIAEKQLKLDYGDAGDKITKMLRDEHKTVTQILNELNGQEKIEFLEFLNNTIEGRYINSLTTDELAAITRYTSGDYQKINTWLRTNEIPLHEKSYIDTLNSALSKFGGIKGDTQLIRGIDITSFTGQKAYERIFDGVNTSDITQVYGVLKLLEGGEFFDAGYMSASPSYKHSFAKWQSKNIVLNILAEDGTAGAYINQVSEFYNLENEFLLAAGTKLEMVEVMPPTTIDGQEKIIINCRIKK